MDFVNTELVERYQMMLQKDPASKVFAPLAEALRKMGMVDEARRICEVGVSRHPQFPSGRVALAKILLDREEPQKAVEQLQVAVELSPENILAHSLLADTLLLLKQPREALRSFKMVLFLNPKDEKAQKTIKKLESLTASEYDAEVFRMKRLPDSPRPTKNAPLDPGGKQRTLERYISLVDAYIVRNDADKAFETLDSAANVLGPHPDIEKRKALLKSRMDPPPVDDEIEIAPPEKSPRLLKLEALLERIEARRLDGAI